MSLVVATTGVLWMLFFGGKHENNKTRRKVLEDVHIRWTPDAVINEMKYPRLPIQKAIFSGYFTRFTTESGGPSCRIISKSVFYLIFKRSPLKLQSSGAQIQQSECLDWWAFTVHELLAYKSPPNLGVKIASYFNYSVNGPTTGTSTNSASQISTDFVGPLWSIFRLTSTAYEPTPRLMEDLLVPKTTYPGFLWVS